LLDQKYYLSLFKVFHIDYGVNMVDKLECMLLNYQHFTKLWKISFTAKRCDEVTSHKNKPMSYSFLLLFGCIDEDRSLIFLHGYRQSDF